jgi:hypothetical protein
MIPYGYCHCGCGNLTAKTTEGRGGIPKGTPRNYLNGHHSLRHGHAKRTRKSSTYNSWAHMIHRCTNPNNSQWRDYGGRGITVCARWMKFENFFADMGEAPKGLSLDRIDNDGNYEPGNCRWATRLVQQNNQRMRKTNTSGFPGVYKNRCGRWYAQLTINRARYSLGTFATREEAAAYLATTKATAGEHTASAGSDQ